MNKLKAAPSRAAFTSLTNMKKTIILLCLALALLMACEKAGTPSGGETKADPIPLEELNLPETTPKPTPPEVSYPLDDKYERGDLPRIYIDTSKDIPNFAEGHALTVEGGKASDAATDGDTSTVWHSDADGELSFTVDLGEVKTASYAQIAWGVDAGVEYEVLASADGSSWTTIKTEENGFRSKRDHIEFDPILLRWLRVDIHKSNRGAGYEISELYVMAERIPTTGRTTITTGEYVPVKLAVVDKEGGLYHTIEETVGIRIRGNSTAASDKKPYNIKFETKKTLLGIEGSRKWCLLANHFDKTLIRNKIAYDFCKTAGVPCTLESAMVEIFLDGKYKGLYQLTEPVSDAKTSVDIDTEHGEYLLERNGYYNFGEKWNHSPLYGIRFVCVKPEGDELSSARKTAIGSYLKEADMAAKSKSFKRIASVFDVDSFVSFYICEELMKDIDIYHGSTYFYIKNGKIYSGPMWDMDLSMGNVSKSVGLTMDSEEKYRIYWNIPNYFRQSYGNGSGDSTEGLWAQVDWYGPLMECEEFASRVKQKFEELQPAIRDLYEDGGAIDRLLADCYDGCIRDYTDYGTQLDVKYFNCEYDEFFSTYDEAVQYMKDWLRARNKWLCGYFGVEFVEG